MNFYLFCGLFSFLALYYKANKHNNESLMALSIGMGTQLMNSILYMCNYFHQCNDPDSINYDNASFPMGWALLNRPFMWVNVCWTLFPLYVICRYLCCYLKNRKRRSSANSHINYRNKYNKYKKIDLEFAVYPQW